MAIFKDVSVKFWPLASGGLYAVVVDRFRSDPEQSLGVAGWPARRQEPSSAGNTAERLATARPTVKQPGKEREVAMSGDTRADRDEPTTEALDTLIGSLQGGKTTSLADAVESVVQKSHLPFERALSMVDDAIIDGTLTINGAFEVGLE